MLVGAFTKSVGIKPFVGSLSESTQVRFRWFKDSVENKKIRRSGYLDRVKFEGPLPRLKNDTAPIKQLPAFKVKNTWAEHKALAGQNDYIDILGRFTLYEIRLTIVIKVCSLLLSSGSDEIHPKQILCHVPKYLRGVNKGNNYFQVRLSFC